MILSWLLCVGTNAIAGLHITCYCPVPFHRGLSRSVPPEFVCVYVYVFVYLCEVVCVYGSAAATCMHDRIGYDRLHILHCASIAKHDKASSEPEKGCPCHFFLLYTV